MTRLLEGEVTEAPDPQVLELENEIRSLHRHLDDARLEAKRAREDADRALSALRRQLSPLYRALQAVFGELDAAGIDDVEPIRQSVAQPSSDRVSAVWQSWKERLGPSCGKLIDALLLHSDLNTQQLAIAAGMSRQNVSNLIVKLNRAGLLNKNSGRFSLKTL